VVRKNRNRTAAVRETAAQRLVSRHAAIARVARLTARAAALGNGISPAIRRLRAIVAIFRPVAAFGSAASARLKSEPDDITTSRFIDRPRALEANDDQRTRQYYGVRSRGAAIFNLLSNLVSPAARILQMQSAAAAYANPRKSYGRPTPAGWLASASSNKPGTSGLSSSTGVGPGGYALQDKRGTGSADADSTRDGSARSAATSRRARSPYRNFISALNRNGGGGVGILRLASRRNSGVGDGPGTRLSRRISPFDRPLERNGSAALTRLAAFGRALGSPSPAADGNGRRYWRNNSDPRSSGRNIEAGEQRLRGQVLKLVSAGKPRALSSAAVQETLPIVAQAPFSANERPAAHPRGRAIVVNYSPTLIVNAGSDTRIEDRLLEIIGQHGYELANILEREYGKRVRTEL